MRQKAEFNLDFGIDSRQGSNIRLNYRNFYYWDKIFKVIHPVHSINTLPGEQMDRIYHAICRGTGRLKNHKLYVYICKSLFLFCLLPSNLFLRVCLHWKICGALLSNQEIFSHSFNSHITTPGSHEHKFYNTTHNSTQWHIAFDKKLPDVILENWSSDKIIIYGYITRNHSQNVMSSSIVWAFMLPVRLVKHFVMVWDTAK